MKYCIAGLLVCLAISIGKGQACNTKQVNAYLKKVFRKGNLFYGNTTIFSGYDTAIKRLETPVLNMLLPGYCFYTVNLYSNAPEYGKVETAIAFSKKTTTAFRWMLSPLFTREDTGFIKLFYGLTAPDTIQRAQLAQEITGIFSAITYEGHINILPGIKESNAISFELWRGNTILRKYDFYFNTKAILTQIQIREE